MKATINDVSRLAKVSISTVSHVLNGTRPVNEDTRQRVLRAIEETGYIPNLMAKGLKQAQTQTIGLLVTDIKNEFFTDVVHIIDTEARKDGYQVFVSSSDEDPQKEHEIIRAFCERRVDGIIWSPTRDSDKFSLEYLRRMQVPVVMIDRSIGGDFDFVGVENYESTKLLAETRASSACSSWRIRSAKKRRRQNESTQSYHLHCRRAGAGRTRRLHVLHRPRSHHLL